MGYSDLSSGSPIEPAPAPRSHRPLHLVMPGIHQPDPAAANTKYACRCVYLRHSIAAGQSKVSGHAKRTGGPAATGLPGPWLTLLDAQGNVGWLMNGSFVLYSHWSEIGSFLAKKASTALTEIVCHLCPGCS